MKSKENGSYPITWATSWAGVVPNRYSPTDFGGDFGGSWQGEGFFDTRLVSPRDKQENLSDSNRKPGTEKKL